MTRSLVALLLALACTPARAQTVRTELYGDFRYSYNRADAGDSTYWASANNASRLGVRAEVSEGKLAVFSDLQVVADVDADGTNAAFVQAYYYAGVRGPFGTITVGRQSTAYKLAGLRLDPFYDLSKLSTVGNVPRTGLFAGGTFGLSSLTNGWADRTVAYVSPPVRGISANAVINLDTQSDHDGGLGLAYRERGWDVGVQYYEVNGGRTWTQAAAVDRAVRTHAGYGRERWSVGASYERLGATAGGDQDFLYASGTFAATPRLLLAGALAHVGGGAIQPVSGPAVHAGAFYTLVPPARVHLIYSHLDADARPDRSNLALGMTYQVSIAR